MTYKEREARLIADMENRTDYNDGLKIPELCKRVLDYDMQVLSDKEKKERIGENESATEEEKNDYATKCFQDEKKANQIKRMLRRTREKYRPGTRYNDTNLQKHQYYLLPPRLQQEDRQWRAVHIIRGINGHLLLPLIMRNEKYIATSERRKKRVVQASKRSEEEREELLQKEIRERFSRHTTKEAKKLVSELKKEKRLPRKYKPDYERIDLVFDTELDKMMQKYGSEIRSVIARGDEQVKILKDIIVSNCEKKQYILKFDWELLDYLKQKRKGALD